MLGGSLEGRSYWLKRNGHVVNAITGLRYADHLRDAEFKIEVIPN